MRSLQVLVVSFASLKSHCQHHNYVQVHFQPEISDLANINLGAIDVEFDDGEEVRGAKKREGETFSLSSTSTSVVPKSMFPSTYIFDRKYTGIMVFSEGMAMRS